MDNQLQTIKLKLAENLSKTVILGSSAIQDDSRIELKKGFWTSSPRFAGEAGQNDKPIDCLNNLFLPIYGWKVFSRLQTNQLPN